MVSATVKLYDSYQGALLAFTQAVGAALAHVARLDGEGAATKRVDCSDADTVLSGHYGVREQQFMVPDKMPGLRKVEEIIEFCAGHRTGYFYQERRSIKYVAGTPGSFRTKVFRGQNPDPAPE